METENITIIKNENYWQNEIETIINNAKTK